jgi:hypothetical protein
LKAPRIFHGRNADSTIIAGIIVLTLLLTALGTMVFMTQQYDRYQNLVNLMSQKDIERFSENIAPVPPNLTVSNQPVQCTGGSCNQYTMTLDNNGPIGVQIVRIYINSTSTCSSLCIFGPSNVSAPFTFQASAAFINAGDSSHALTFWLPNNLQLPSNAANANTISLVTSRGRVFTFGWRSPIGVAVPSELRYDAGPLRIVYDSNLITFTENLLPAPGPTGCANNYPSATPCYSAGWNNLIPPGSIVFYIRIINIGGAPVTLLANSYLLAEGTQGGNPTTDLEQFYIVTPMSQTCHDTYFSSSDYEVSSWPRTGDCPIPSTITQGYNASYWAGQCNLSNPCYQLVNATRLGVPGTPTYVLFSSQKVSGTISGALKASYNYFLYLELSYQYAGYEYTISIPLAEVNT